MPNPVNPRIAILGFSIECNKFAPPATKAHFLARTYLEGDAILAEARGATPTMLPETPGFVAALTTAEDDPEGALFETVRHIVGAGVPVVATFDLHANVSDRMVDLIDAFIGYRTNPHLDMRERGAEAAAAMRELLGGTKTELVRLRLPIVPPTVTLLTAAGPYAEMIELGQRRMTPDIMNVSVMGGFAYADTAKNGLTVVVTARGDRAEAAALARDIAQYGWDNRARFYPKLTSLDEA